MKKITALIVILLSLNSCVSNRVFNDLESRYAQLKDNFNRQTKSIENLNTEIKDLTKKFITLEETLEKTEDSLNQKQQKLEQLESSLDLLKQNSETELKKRIAENEELMEKIAERENELPAVLVTDHTSAEPCATGYQALRQGSQQDQGLCLLKINFYSNPEAQEKGGN